VSIAAISLVKLIARVLPLAKVFSEAADAILAVPPLGLLWR